MKDKQFMDLLNKIIDDSDGSNRTLLEEMSILYSLEETEHSENFWNKVEAVLEKRKKRLELPMLIDIRQVSSLFASYLSAADVQQERMKGKSHDSAVGLHRRSFICIVILHYAPKFLQKNEKITLPYGLISEISRVLEIARSWVHELVLEVQTRYQIYHEFKTEITSLIQKMYG